jgi:alkanesulfonate monooxygenase SsuD/methylene tetrahydromethanopterin reductase-like flavin-dependent oxidoreductase (luciferase family)
MPAISITASSVVGLDWPRWQRLAAEVEALGFAGLYRFDHFAHPVESQDPDMLDLTTSLAYLAMHTQQIHFGPLVAPLSFRDPHILAREAVALDDLSGGRMILGVGAGGNEREHTMFGYALGDIPTRMDRFEEGLAVITALLHSSEPVTYEGRFFKLHDAVLRPRPQQPGGPPILIGGKGPKRTLPLVARYADIWNTDSLSPNEVRDRSMLLDELLLKAGRQPKDVKRTANVRLFCGHDSAELEQRIIGLRHIFPAWNNLPTVEFLNNFGNVFSNLIVGTPEEVVAQLRAYAEVGIEELMIQWSVTGDIEGLQLLAEYVLPHFAA